MVHIEKETAYENLNKNNTLFAPVFNYNDISENQHSEIIEKKDLVDKSRDKFAYSIIGGGNHFKSTLYPEINKLKINKNYAIQNGLSSKFLVDQLGFGKASNSLNDFIKMIKACYSCYAT